MRVIIIIINNKSGCLNQIVNRFIIIRGEIDLFKCVVYFLNKKKTLQLFVGRKERVKILVILFVKAAVQVEVLLLVATIIKKKNKKLIYLFISLDEF